jgi:hypothetical protein
VRHNVQHLVAALLLEQNQAMDLAERMGRPVVDHQQERNLVEFLPRLRLLKKNRIHPRGQSNRDAMLRLLAINKEFHETT